MGKGGRKRVKGVEVRSLGRQRAALIGGAILRIAPPVREALWKPRERTSAPSSLACCSIKGGAPLFGSGFLMNGGGCTCPVISSSFNLPKCWLFYQFLPN